MSSRRTTDLIEMIDKKLEKLDSRLDKIDEKTDRMDNTLAKQNVQLTYHIKRTDILEKRLSTLDRHKNNIELIVRIIGWVATIVVGGIGLIKTIAEISSLL